eukprot:g4315.t1
MQFETRDQFSLDKSEVKTGSSVSEHKIRDVIRNEGSRGINQNLESTSDNSTSSVVESTNVTRQNVFQKTPNLDRIPKNEGLCRVRKNHVYREYKTP